MNACTELSTPSAGRHRRFVRDESLRLVLDELLEALTDLDTAVRAADSATDYDTVPQGAFRALRACIELHGMARDHLEALSQCSGFSDLLGERESEVNEHGLMLEEQRAMFLALVLPRWARWVEKRELAVQEFLAAWDTQSEEILRADAETGRQRPAPAWLLSCVGEAEDTFHELTWAADDLHELITSLLEVDIPARLTVDTDAQCWADQLLELRQLRVPESVNVVGWNRDGTYIVNPARPERPGDNMSGWAGAIYDTIKGRPAPLGTPVIHKKRKRR